jgi:hypothetical protein
LNEPDFYVRAHALKAFKHYSMLGQLEVFQVFCLFLYGESCKVRKHYVTFFRQFQFSIISHWSYLLSSLKQIPSLIKENLEIWLSFPKIIPIGKFILIYSETIFEKFFPSSNKRINTDFQNKNQIFLDSAFHRIFDEC